MFIALNVIGLLDLWVNREDVERKNNLNRYTVIRIIIVII